MKAWEGIGQETGFKPVGFIELAAGEDRLEEYRRIAAFNRWHGIDTSARSPSGFGHYEII